VAQVRPSATALRTRHLRGETDCGTERRENTDDDGTEGRIEISCKWFPAGDGDIIAELKSACQAIFENFLDIF
jgi:hypothetical protein